MSIPKFRMFSSLVLVLGLLVFAAPLALSQDSTATVGSRVIPTPFFPDRPPASPARSPH